MKVIFLDIDGVMNTDKTPVRWNDKGHLLAMDQDKVFAINNMVDLHSLKVVLSSSWRCDKDWREVMKSNGFLFEFLGSTPDYAGNTGRGTEIKAWLDAAKALHPPVERYAIIDDDTSMHKDQMPNYFRTYYPSGLTPEMAADVVKHLTA